MPTRTERARPSAALAALVIVSGCGGGDLPGVEPPPAAVAPQAGDAPPPGAGVKRFRPRTPQPEVQTPDPSALRLRTR